MSSSSGASGGLQKRNPGDIGSPRPDGRFATNPSITTRGVYGLSSFGFLFLGMPSYWGKEQSSADRVSNASGNKLLLPFDLYFDLKTA